MSAVFWLAPILTRSPFTIGKQRIQCASEPFARFREQLQRLATPRHLLMFKAELLLSDDADFCGTTDAALPSLTIADDIIFDGKELVLSHCAEAFLDRLPDAREWQTFLTSHSQQTELVWTIEERQWLDTLARWSEQQYEIVVLREE